MISCCHGLIYGVYAAYAAYGWGPRAEETCPGDGKVKCLGGNGHLSDQWFWLACWLAGAGWLYSAAQWLYYAAQRLYSAALEPCCAAQGLYSAALEPCYGAKGLDSVALEPCYAAQELYSAALGHIMLHRGHIWRICSICCIWLGSEG